MQNLSKCAAALLLCLFSTVGRAQTKPSAPAKQKAAPSQPAKVQKPAPPATPQDATTLPSGLTMMITRHGAGVPTKTGDIVLVHYTGLLTTGVKFDSSRDRNDPIAFKLGAGRVIKGWDEGVAKLRVGDQAVLVIPPALGYGSRNVGNGVIPPDSTLVFVIEVVDVKAKALSDELAKTLDEKGVDAMVTQFHELQQTGFGDLYAGESDLNGLGYHLLNGKKFQEAIAVFNLNVEAFPNSANVYDSLAEAYMTNGDKQLAIENYNKALAIDPNMESAKTNLKKLNEN